MKEFNFVAVDFTSEASFLKKLSLLIAVFVVVEVIYNFRMKKLFS